MQLFQLSRIRVHHEAVRHAMDHAVRKNRELIRRDVLFPRIERLAEFSGADQLSKVSIVDSCTAGFDYTNVRVALRWKGRNLSCK